MPSFSRCRFFFFMMPFLRIRCLRRYTGQHSRTRVRQRHTRMPYSLSQCRAAFHFFCFAFSPRHYFSFLSLIAATLPCCADANMPPFLLHVAVAAAFLFTIHWDNRRNTPIFCLSPDAATMSRRFSPPPRFSPLIAAIDFQPPCHITGSVIRTVISRFFCDTRLPLIFDFLRYAAIVFIFDSM